MSYYKKFESYKKDDINFINEGLVELKKYLSRFKDDASNWREATDELRDIARTAKEYFNEANEDGEQIEALNFNTIKTPPEWNIKSKKYILMVYDKMDDDTKKRFNKYLKNHFEINENIKLVKVSNISKIETALNKNIIDESEYNKLMKIINLIDKGEIVKAKKEILKLDNLLKGYVPELPEFKLKGSVVVDFEISSNTLGYEDLEDYIKLKIENHLNNEGQIYTIVPNMDTFKIKK